MKGRPARPAVTWNRHDARVVALLSRAGEEQVVAAIRHLFSGRQEVALEAISQGKSAAAVLLARPIAGDGIPEVYRAVKIAPVGSLKVETENYKKYVAGKLSRAPDLSPTYLPPAGTGAVAYTFVGNREEQIRPLGQLLVEALAAGKSDDIIAIITQLFKNYLNPWYFNPLHAASLNLFQAFDLSPGQLTDLQKLSSLDPTIKPEALVDRWRQLRSEAGLTLTRLTVVHGDLHSGNAILSGRDNQLSLIDFGLTGEGHFLKDFVKLEADIKFRFLIPALQGEASDPRSYLRLLDRELLSPDSFQRMSSDELRSPKPGALSAARAVLRTIRTRASDRMEGDSSRIAEYFVGLLRYTLRMALYDDVDDMQRICMLDSAKDILASLEVDGFNHLVSWRPNLDLIESSIFNVPLVRAENERDAATRKFAQYNLIAWSGFSEGQLKFNVSFPGREGSRTADIVVYSDARRVRALLVCNWVSEADGGHAGADDGSWEWWAENTDLRCLVLYGPGTGWRDKQMFSRSSPRGRFIERYSHDAIPSVLRFDSLDDPCETRARPIVKAMLDHGETSEEFIKFLVDRYGHVSFLTLHGSSSLYDPLEARAIVDALASIEDSALQLSILRETDIGGFGRREPDRHHFMWRWEEENRASGLFVPLWWRFSSEARLQYLQEVKRFGERPLGQEFLLREFLGLRLDVDRDFRDFFDSHAEEYRHVENYPEDGRYEARPLQELWRPRELSYELTNAIPPEFVRRVGVSTKEWDHLETLAQRLAAAQVRAAQLLDSNEDLDPLLLGPDGEGLLTTNLLGMYAPETVPEIGGDTLENLEKGGPCIYLYARIIHRAARLLGVSAHALSTVVWIHETVHAFTHLGRDLDNRIWENFALPSSELLRPDFRPSRLHETLAQYYTFKLLDRLGDQVLLSTFEDLEKHQPSDYRAWRVLGEKPLEEMRDFLMRARREPAIIR